MNEPKSYSQSETAEVDPAKMIEAIEDHGSRPTIDEVLSVARQAVEVKRLRAELARKDVHLKQIRAYAATKPISQQVAGWYVAEVNDALEQPEGDSAAVAQQAAEEVPAILRPMTEEQRANFKPLTTEEVRTAFARGRAEARGEAWEFFESKGGPEDRK